MKLTKAQQRAYDKLTDEWQMPYSMRERWTTLDALVRRGLAAEKRHKPIVWPGMESTQIQYRRRKPEPPK